MFTQIDVIYRIFDHIIHELSTFFNIKRRKKKQRKKGKRKGALLPAVRIYKDWITFTLCMTFATFAKHGGG